MAVTDDRPFAYTLCENQPSAWAWRVYDTDGALVSAGEAGTKVAAERAIAQVYDAPLAPAAFAQASAPPKDAHT